MRTFVFADTLDATALQVRQHTAALVHAGFVDVATAAQVPSPLPPMTCVTITAQPPPGMSNEQAIGLGNALMAEPHA